MVVRMSIFLVVFFNSIGSTFSQNRSPLDLVGKWRNIKSNPETGELWTLKDSTEIIGFGYKMKKDSMHLTESLMLKKMNGYWLYIAQVGKQQPISFTLDTTSRSSLLFVNKEHDFPQYIFYEFVDNDHVRVDLGSYKNKKVISLFFKRIDK